MKLPKSIPGGTLRCRRLQMVTAQGPQPELDISCPHWSLRSIQGQLARLTTEGGACFRSMAEIQTHQSCHEAHSELPGLSF